MKFRLQNKRIWIAGHNGMVGGALVRRFDSEPCDLLLESRATLDLLDQHAVTQWLQKTKPDAIIIAAAKVGGIQANSSAPAKFLYENMTIASNIIHAAWQAGVQKLIFLGSSCIYPKLAPQPIKEDYLLDGPLEPTNEWYAIAKIAGIKLCQAYRKQYGADFISAQPTNLYGPGDNYDLETSHVLPALLRKFHLAKKGGAPDVTIWGSGKPLREFMHVDDLSDALVFLLREYSGDVPVNIGSGEEVSILGLAKLVSEVTGYKGEIAFDAQKPDGTPRKLMDSSFLNSLGWNNVRGLEVGVQETYQDLKSASWF